MANLDVQIGADIKDFLNKTSKVKKDLKNTAKISEQAGKKISSVGMHAGKGISKLGKSTANATPALQEFSRVIQDAPFGIMGVGNNIQQLTANFGHLSKSAGGSKAAIKAMVASLAGPGGVLLAVSAVTTLLTVYREELSGILDTTNKVAAAQSEYVATAQSEITALKQLLSIANDENLSKEVRQKALDKINKEYSKYLGNLDLESLKTDKVKNSVDALTTSLIQQAKIKGISKLIEEENTKNAEDLLSLEIKRNNIIKSIASNEKRISEMQKGAEKSRASSNLSRIKANLTSVNQEISEINKSANEALKPLLQVQRGLQVDVYENKPVANSETGGIVKTSPKVSKKATEDFSKALAKIDSDIFKEELDNQLEIPDMTGVPLVVKPELDFSQADAEFAEMMANFEKRKEQAAMLGQGVSDAFGAMANGIAQNIDTGSSALDAFAESFISSMSKVIQQMIQNAAAEKAIAAGKIAKNQAVATSEAVVVGTSTAAASGPAAAFLLPALIAGAVAVIGGAFSKIGGFAKGTSSFSGDNNLAMVNRNEMILQPNQSASLFNAFKAGGTGLKGQSSSSGWDGEIKGNIALRGDKQRIQLVRANKKHKRFYN